MGTSDSAFLWETEALRTRQTGSSTDWVTLRQAHADTGVAITTLRRWAQRDVIPSYLESTPTGQLRMVSLQAARRRAAEIGRPKPNETRPSPPVGEIPIRQRVAEETPPGTMIVPIDAWDKMLMQLGNLHQAGQELAEARERAARAETEVKFLKQRLAERRMESPQPDRFKPRIPESDPGPPPSVPADQAKSAEPTKSPGFTRLLWRALWARPKS